MAVVRRRIAVTLALLIMTAAPVHAQAPTETAVKAAFLVKFANYVDWPPDRDDSGPFVLAILGSDPFGEMLDRMLIGKEVNGRKLIVRRFRSPEDAVKEAKILFISTSVGSELTEILRIAEQHAVLTVGDMERFAPRGGMVGFRAEGNRVRFDINVEQAGRAGLKVSSQLLKLARIVRTGKAA